MNSFLYDIFPEISFQASNQQESFLLENGAKSHRSSIRFSDQAEGVIHISSQLWDHSLKKNLKCNSLSPRIYLFFKIFIEKFWKSPVITGLLDGPFSSVSGNLFPSMIFRNFWFSLLNTKIKRNEVWVEWREKFLMKNVIKCQIS